MAVLSSLPDSLGWGCFDFSSSFSAAVLEDRFPAVELVEASAVDIDRELVQAGETKRGARCLEGVYASTGHHVHLPVTPLTWLLTRSARLEIARQTR